MLTILKRKLKNLLQNKAVILMYHQVCERPTDPWELAVSPARFDEQLGELKKQFDVVALEEIVRSVKSKSLSGKKVAITFDDGFRDNYTNAKPILEKHNLPATFYVATDQLNTARLYWWDDLELLILHTETLPRKLEIAIGEEELMFEFARDQRLTSEVKNQILNWRAEMPPYNERLKLCMLLWMKIQPLPFDQQRTLMSAIRNWAGPLNHEADLGQVMTYDQLTALARNPLFSVGAHTVHHAMLAAHDAKIQAFEVQESKNVIEDFLSRKITGFAYPYGNYNHTTKLVLRDAGFQHAVCTEQRFVTSNDDIFELPRMQVKNWTGKEFLMELNKLLKP